MARPHDSDAGHLRRVVRALIRQRGGVMMLRLMSSHHEVRLSCTLQGARAIALAVESSEAGCAVVRDALAALRAECVRASVELARVDGLDVAPGDVQHALKLTRAA